MAKEESTSSQIFYESVVKEELIIEDELPPEPHCEDTFISTSGFEMTIQNESTDHDELGKPETVPRPTLRCGKCKKLFHQFKSYKVHCKKHDAIEGKHFLCKPCRRPFATKHGLFLHRRLKHGGDQLEGSKDPEVIPIRKRLRNSLTLKKYENKLRILEVTEAKKLVQCETCGLYVGSHNEMEEHEFSKHGKIKAEPSEEFETDEKGHLKCNECPKTFRKRYGLLRHIRRRKAIDQGWFQCKICGECLGSNRCLLNHSLKEHNEYQKVILDPLQMEGSDRFKCPRCPETFARRKMCSMHIRRHTAIDKALYKCKACLKCFSDQNSLNRHEQGALKNQTRSGCFLNRQRLEPENTDKKYHVIEENGVFKCSDCKSVFPKRSGCVAHIYRHEAIDKGKMKCQKCGKKFSCFPSLRKHALVIHGEKMKMRTLIAIERDENEMFLCSECPRKYATRRTCIVHMRGHKNVRSEKYKCEECQMCFERNDILVSHVSKHKKEKSATSKASTSKEGQTVVIKERLSDVS